jgi:hypothetical protein
MHKKVQSGLVILGLMLPLISHAQQCGNTHGDVSAARTCDVTFTSIPTFTNLCLATIQQGAYTIRNNTPVTLKINYIRIKNNDALPTQATAIVVAPSNNCGSSLAAGASCNILLNLQPLALGNFNRTLQIGIDTRQVELDGAPITSAVNCTPAAPPVPVVPINPAPTPPPPSLFSASILGASTVTSTGLSVVNGDVDVSPGTAVTGFPPGTVVNGTIHSADATAATAQANALAYYNSAVALACPAANNLTGQDLVEKHSLLAFIALVQVHS